MKIHLRMLGCRLNQSEIETMARQFQQQGHEIVDDPALADQIVVNTCAVTNDAVRDSRKLVRQLHRAGDQAAITVTGCYAQIAPDEIAVLPGVARVIDNLGKDELVPTLTGQPLSGIRSSNQSPAIRRSILPEPAPSSRCRTAAITPVPSA